MEELHQFSSVGMKKEANLEDAMELLRSLIRRSYATQCYPAKWQLIRDKLDDLLCGMNHAKTGQDSAVSVSPFVQSLVSTLVEIETVLVHSSEQSYNAGRLLLTSNLNRIISMLDFHIEELSETFRAVVGSAHSSAILPVKPVVGARVEYIKFYIRDVFSRLAIAGSDVKADTLAALGGFLAEDERYVQILTREIDDGIEILVNFLDSEDAAIKEEALRVVSVIARFDSYRGFLARAGVINPLVRALEKDGSIIGKERAVHALSKLTENSENVWSFVAHGGVSVIVTSLKCSDDFPTVGGGEFTSSIFDIMKNLFRVDEIKQFLVDEGAIRVLVNLLNTKPLQENCKIRVLELLGQISWSDETHKRKPVDGISIACLTELLDPDVPFCSKTREVSLKFIQSLLPHFAPNAGLVKCIVFYLKVENHTIQESALKIMWQLCKLSDQYKSLIGESGGLMIELIHLVNAKSFQVREMAAETVANLASVNHVRQTFVQHESGLKELMRLLDPSESKSATTKFLLSALIALSESSYARMKMIASGHVENLEKLAETGEPDAKKILKKLSSS